MGVRVGVGSAAVRDERQTRGSDVAALLAAANLEVSEPRLESLAEELVAIATSATGVVDVVMTRPDSIPAVVFLSPPPEQDDHR
jgi:hypothetical protein